MWIHTYKLLPLSCAWSHRLSISTDGQAFANPHLIFIQQATLNSFPQHCFDRCRAIEFILKIIFLENHNDEWWRYERKLSRLVYRPVDDDNRDSSFCDGDCLTDPLDRKPLMEKKMKLTRRQIIGGLALGSAGLAMPAVFTGRGHAYGLSVNALKIPPLITGRTRNGRKIFDLNVQSGVTEFIAGKSTSSYGYSGSFLGPVLRVRNNDWVTFNVKNSLQEPMTTHWHGLHVPAYADGGPHQIIHPGETWSPEFQIKQKAATFWYHPHLMGKTGEHIYKGLAGLIIVDDEEADALSLPSDYGVDDIPLIVQDRRFRSDGQFQYVSMMPDRMMGMKGDVVLVNGTTNSQLKLKRKRTRLRLLNGSNSRVYNFGFDDGRHFHQIATDGSLLRTAVKRNRLRLAPGERTEILVNFESNSSAVLMSYADVSAGRGSGAMMRMMGMGGNHETLRIMEMRADRLEDSNMELPKLLSEVPNWSISQADRTRRFELQGMGMMGGGSGGMMGRGSGSMMSGGMMRMWRINGRTMNMARIDERIPLDSTEIWEIHNSSNMLHPFHVHDIQFRIIDRNGGAAKNYEQGLKDTVIVDSGETVRVIAKFEDYADPKLPYMYHCHNLEHEDAGMMGQFTVEA